MRRYVALLVLLAAGTCAVAIGETWPFHLFIVASDAQ